MNRWKSRVLFAIGLVAGINLLWFMIFSFEMKGLYNDSKQGRLPNIQEWKSVEQMYRISDWISMGAKKLPYLRLTDRLIKDVFTTGSIGLELVENGKAIAHTSLAGNEVPLADIEAVILGMEKLRGQLDALNFTLEQPELEQLAALSNQEENLVRQKTRIRKISNEIEKFALLQNNLPQLLGYDTPKHYIILFQNNMELRPTGGFLGSYGEFWFEQGAFKNLTIQDIYVPDGQIKGYVKEPEPIREHLFRGETPGWRLRDGNWNPDFPTAASDLHWFFKEGKVSEADGFIAINLFPIIDVMKVVGEVKLIDFQETITADNFYQLAQYYAENDFFPGSTQKKDFLSKVGKQLIWELMEKPDEYLPQLLKPMYENLETKQILIALIDPELNGYFGEKNWDGHLKLPTCPQNLPCNLDYLSLNEANVGINKTNCCVDRDITMALNPVGENLEHTLKIVYTNHNPGTPEPPLKWGGGYKNYLRIFVPKAAQVNSVTIDGVIINPDIWEVEDFGELKSIGFVSLVNGGQKGTVEMTYATPYIEGLPYAWYIQKQSGIEMLPFTITGMNDLALTSHDTDWQSLTQGFVKIDRDIWLRSTN